MTNFAYLIYSYRRSTKSGMTTKHWVLYWFTCYGSDE